MPNVKKKITKTRLIIRRLFIAACLLVIVFFVSNLLYKVNSKTILRVGNFTISPYTKDIYTKSSGGKNISSNVSSFLSDSNCPSVAGVVNLRLNIKARGVKQDESPYYSVVFWNFNSLAFKKPIDKKNLPIRISSSLQNLSLYTDNSKLLNLVFGPSFNANGLSAISTSPWRGLDSCNGYFSYPIYIKNVDQNKFDQVIYAESLEGQDLDVPVNVLVIKEGNDWIIFKENNHIGLESYYKDIEGCYKEVEPIKCAENIWSKKYRNSNKIDNWINQSLKMIEYSPTK